jgi:3-carboxy-cis,cis-muconate cycloisomerase
MPTALDSSIFGPLFGDDEINSLFTDEAYVRALVEVEVALARAEALVGVVPSEAAEQIAKTQANRIDIAALVQGTIRSGFPLIALVEELRKQAGEQSAQYVHWGATTQDIMDTACVLQARGVIRIFQSRLRDVARQLCQLAERHRDTVLAGRTHSQQALPITFGLKVAGWLAPLVRHTQRLDELSRRLLIAQFGGAAGTLAALGDKGLAVAQALAGQLNLAAPEMPWHAQRDNFAEFAGWLSLMTGSLAKMAQDIILMAQTEIGELGESGEQERGGSSTMPQKSNPISSELIVAAARMNGSLLSAMHQALIQEHERATHGWQVEWLTLPQMMVLTGGALKHASYLAKNLQIDAMAMLSNIARANDVILAEAAVFALTKTMARRNAEELVRKACAVAVSQNKPLIEVVKTFAAHAVKKGEIDWQALAKSENYLGQTQKMIDAVLQRARNIYQT